MLKTLSFLFFIVSTHVFSQDYSWELTKQGNNYQIFLSESKFSNFKAYRLEALVDFEPDILVAMIYDVKNLDKLVPGTLNQKKIDEYSDTAYYLYNESYAPWPISNRDGVYFWDYNYDFSTKELLINMKADPQRIPEKDGIVRIPYMVGLWKMYPEKTKWKLIYQIDAAPGGLIPAWLANSAVIDQPLDMYNNLLKRSKLIEYQNQKFSFLK